MNNNDIKKVKSDTNGCEEKTAQLANTNEQLLSKVEELKKTEETLQQRTKELGILHEFSHQVSTSILIDKVVQMALKGILSLVSADLALLYLREGNKLLLQGLDSNDHKLSHKGDPVHRVGQCLCGLAVSEKQPIYSRDIHNDPRCTLEECKNAGLRSFIALPLRIRNDIIGVLGIASLTERDFETHTTFLASLANEIAIGCQNAVLYQQIHHKTTELEREIAERERTEKELRSALEKIEQLKEQLQADYTYLREEIKLEHNFDEIIGQSDELKYVLFKIEQVAPTDTTALILGETGTGKELVARAIHNTSTRNKRPLVKVDCAALPPNLIESELFGHEKGAFTGSQTKQVGRFELAHGSTIFLDEIGEIPLELQAKLLRFIQDGEFERLGSSRTIKVDVRIIAATNRDLEEEVRSGSFRQDLWYRLNIFPVTLPPLRQRTDDIPLLVNAFVKKFSKKIGKDIKKVPTETIETLQKYTWPGNVRELENVIERAVINTHGSTLNLADKLETPQEADFTTDRKSLKEVERDCIMKVLEETNWKIEGKNGAASILGLNPSTLRGRMRNLDIRRK